MYRDILVVTDGSLHSEVALERAVGLAEEHHSRLTLLGAVVTPPSWTLIFALAAGAGVTTAFECRNQAYQHVCAARAQVPASIPLTWLLAEGSAGALIRERCAAGLHDLVVAGPAVRRWLSPCAVPRLIVTSSDKGLRDPAGYASPEPPGCTTPEN